MRLAPSRLSPPLRSPPLVFPAVVLAPLSIFRCRSALPAVLPALLPPLLPASPGEQSASITPACFVPLWAGLPWPVLDDGADGGAGEGGGAAPPGESGGGRRLAACVEALRRSGLVQPGGVRTSLEVMLMLMIFSFRVAVDAPLPLLACLVLSYARGRVGGNVRRQFEYLRTGVPRTQSDVSSCSVAHKEPYSTKFVNSGATLSSEHDVESGS